MYLKSFDFRLKLSADHYPNNEFHTAISKKFTVTNLNTTKPYRRIKSAAKLYSHIGMSTVTI